MNIKQAAEERYPLKDALDNKGLHCSENDIVYYMREAFIAGWLAGQKPECATGLKKAYDILCGELTQLKAGGSYKDTNGYADAIWDLKIILKNDYGIDVPNFKNWQPSPPTGEKAEPGEAVPDLSNTNWMTDENKKTFLKSIQGEDQEGLWIEIMEENAFNWMNYAPPSKGEIIDKFKSQFIIHRK